MSCKFSLNSQVLCKNTKEILNTCVDKIYKQTPGTFKESLASGKVATVRPENPGPLRTYSKEAQTRQRKLSGFYTKKAGALTNGQGDMLTTILTMNKKSSPLHKLHTKSIQKKMPLLKLAGKHRGFASSSLSSCSSSSCRRTSTTYHTSRTSRLRHFYTMNPIATITDKHRVKPDKNFINVSMRQNHTFRRPDQSLNTVLAKDIKNDLMVIDNVIKRRLNGPALQMSPNSLQVNLPELPKRKELLVAEEAVRQQYKYLDESLARYRSQQNDCYDSFYEKDDESEDNGKGKIRESSKMAAPYRIIECPDEKMNKNEVNTANENYTSLKTYMNRATEKWDTDKVEESWIKSVESNRARNHSPVNLENHDNPEENAKKFIIELDSNNSLAIRERWTNFHTQRKTPKFYVPKIQMNMLLKSVPKPVPNAPKPILNAVKPVQNPSTASKKPTISAKSLLYQKGMPSATLISSFSRRRLPSHCHY